MSGYMGGKDAVLITSKKIYFTNKIPAFRFCTLAKPTNNHLLSTPRYAAIFIRMKNIKLSRAIKRKIPSICDYNVGFIFTGKPFFTFLNELLC